MKHKEIAQALSITEGTVEQQMNIAIRKMLDAVSRYYNVVKKENSSVVLMNVKLVIPFIGKKDFHTLYL